VMPKFKAGAAAWHPRTETTELLVNLMEAWTDVLPTSSKNIFLQTTVLPKLKAEVDAWSPKTDVVPLHAWIHPWLPWLSNELEEVYPVIRYKIGVALQEWHPSDSSAATILGPWAKVFKPMHMEALLARCVLPKLAMALQEMAINPANQVVEPFKWVVAWVGVAPLHQLAAIFNREFFPRWIQVLFQWLTGRPDYEEVTRWYLNWKSLFPEQLAADESIKQHFTRALDMMNNVVAGAQIVGNYVQPGAAENLNYLKVTQEREAKGPAANSSVKQLAKESVAAKPKVTVADAMYDSTVSFKEALEQLAEENGYLFLPKAGRQESGKQVYTFGKVSVYMDNRLVYAQQEGAWKPIALDDLVAKAKKK